MDGRMDNASFLWLFWTNPDNLEVRNRIYEVEVERKSILRQVPVRLLYSSAINLVVVQQISRQAAVFELKQNAAF